MDEQPPLNLELTLKLHDWLGKENIEFFREIRQNQGTLISEHFGAGMKVRNFFRKSGDCKGWDDHDFDNRWMSYVNAVLDFAD